MDSEKSQALYVPTDTPDDKKLKDKGKKFSLKFILVLVLVFILIALTVALCFEYFSPIIKERFYAEHAIDTEKIFDGVPIQNTGAHSIIYDKHDELTTAAKDKKSPPWHLDFLINPTRLCETWKDPESVAYQRNPEVKLLILVPSATDHFTHRNVIRSTWGSVAQQPHGPVRLGFVLGTTPNVTEESLIRLESESHGDIIQADIVDSFRNLTAKTVLTLKWVTAHCPHTSYILKTDDDTFVNVPVLMKTLENPVYDPRVTFVGGYVRKGSMPTRVPSDKYYVSEDDFPEAEFPPYVHGSAYVTTGPTAAQLFDASQKVTPFLPLEDVFITGMCADDIDAKLIHEPSFQYSMTDSQRGDIGPLATIHSMEPDDMNNAWEQMIKAIFEALMNAPTDSPSVYFKDISFSDLFSWPSPSNSVVSSGSTSNSWKSFQDKNIFEIFDMMKNQIEEDMNAMEKEFDSVTVNQGELGLDSEEINEPVRQINRGNLMLNSNVEKLVMEALNAPKRNASSSSSFVLYFK